MLAAGATDFGESLSPLLILPFCGLLLAIALLPLALPHWYEKHLHRALVAAIFGLPVLSYLLVAAGPQGLERLVQTFGEYVSFITLLTSLFVITGGIYITGNPVATPARNLGFLAIGAILANLIGTTGAAMVLIRPILRANSERVHKKHVIVFAIFVIANMGGLLTPIGDPPLFLGFLRGVDFFWTLRLFPQWFAGVALVLSVFLLLELRAYRKEPWPRLREDVADYVPVRIAGWINALFLLGVVLAVLLSEPLGRLGQVIHFPFVRELLMLTMVGLSLALGPSGTRKANHFSWHPIIEVAIVFAGIFVAMIPALAILEARGDELGLSEPWHFFWATGLLSSFLDNAPTYLTFTSTAQGFLGLDQLADLSVTSPLAGALWAPSRFLAAISTGAVFMGANSYIGNAPNFMIRAIAEESGVKMPSFFGYMAYSAAVLLPVYVIITIVFFT